VLLFRGTRFLLPFYGKWKMEYGKPSRISIMAKYERFEQTPAWQEAVRLYNAVLDMLEKPNAPFSATFRNQMERAALSVSNNIAEGFERGSTSELSHFLEIARGSSAEARSMSLALAERPRVKPFIRELQKIERLAESCCRQLGGWGASVSGFEFAGQRRASAQTREMKERERKARDFRLKFLRSLAPEHPLYKTEEARQARGEAL
jgi:four helix bundle protein